MHRFIPAAVLLAAFMLPGCRATPVATVDTKPKQVKAVFLLPLKDNDGRDLAKEIEAVEQDLFAEFGGWTYQGVVKGAYRMDDGSKSTDESASYFVLMDEADLPKIEKVLRAFKDKTKQTSVYLTIEPVREVRFVK